MFFISLISQKSSYFYFINSKILTIFSIDLMFKYMIVMFGCLFKKIANFTLINAKKSLSNAILQVFEFKSYKEFLHLLLFIE